jgi:aromatic-L-amino-acid/L-tryptophan decarboxylase
MLLLSLLTHDNVKINLWPASQQRPVPGEGNRQMTASLHHDAASASAASEPPARELSLDPDDWGALRALGHRMLDDTLDRLATVREAPAWRPLPDAVRAEFRRPLPRQGVGEAAAYEAFRAHVAPYPLGNTHPRFWGWVIGSGSPLGTLAELLAAGFNANLSGLGNAGVEVEAQVLDWMKELLDYPRDASGLLTSGGSMANVLGLAVGLDASARRRGIDLAEEGVAAAPRRFVVYGSRETHFSVDKAVRLLGLGRSAYRKLPVDGRYRLDLAALEGAIHADRAAGHEPILVVGNAGTVNTGACDDLTAIAEIAERERLWFHVDGAFGAFARLAPATAPLVAGLERADSLAFDLHKWLHAPIEAACLLVRDAEAHRAAFRIGASYVTDLARGVAHDAMRYADLGPQLTRGFRALKIWLALAAYGADRHAALIAQNVAQARRLASRVDAEPELERLAPVDLNIVCFRYRGTAATDDPVLDALNRELLMRLQERGHAVPSSTVLAGRFALRVCLANHRTRDEDLEFLVAKSLELGRELAAA